VDLGRKARKNREETLPGSGPKIDAPSMRERILAVAGELFYGRGIRAVGVDEIIAKAGIAKATFYRHFPSKEDLIVSYLDARRERLQAAFIGCAEGPATRWQDRVLNVFDGLMRNLRMPGFRGCAFVMAVAEHGDLPRVREAARVYKHFLRDGLCALIDGHVPEPLRLSEQLMLIYEGAIATAAIRPESDPGLHAKSCAATLLATA